MMSLMLLPCPYTINDAVPKRLLFNRKKDKYLYSSYDKSYVCQSTFIYSLLLSRVYALTRDTCIILRFADKTGIQSGP